jgi:type III pantothenate kinase
MLLAVDIGNSTTKLGLFRGEELVDHWRLSTESRAARRTRWRCSSPGCSASPGLRFDRDIDGFAIGSVVPAVTEVYREFAERYLPGQALVVEPGVRTGLALRHEHPQDLGADRILNAVAAQALYGGPAIVVDFGTAISFDAVDDEGRVRRRRDRPGGVDRDRRAGGASRAAAARGDRCAGVRAGRSTVTALQSGIVFGAPGRSTGWSSGSARSWGRG